MLPRVPFNQISNSATTEAGPRAPISFAMGTASTVSCGGGFANFYGLAPRASLTAASLLANCGGVAGAPPCPSDPLNGYFTSALVLGNGQGFFTENPGFNLAGGGTEDWRQGAYISDNWKITPSFTLTAGLRWSVDTDRANQDLPTPLCSDVDSITSSSLLGQRASPRSVSAWVGAEDSPAVCQLWSAARLRIQSWRS